MTSDGARNKNPLLGTLSGQLALLILCTVLFGFAVSWITVSRDMRLELDALAMENLRARNSAVMKAAGEYAARNSGGALPREEVEGWARELGVRITIIGSGGRVMSDSEVSGDRLAELDNHMSRPEVRDALTLGHGTDRRRSETTDEPYMYYAESSPGGFVVRSSYPLSRHYVLLSEVRRNIAGSLALAAALALAAGIAGARRVTRPVRQLMEASRAAREGRHAAYPAEGAAEILELSRVMSESARLQAKMVDELRSERNELETIVQSAPCGLMLLDANGIIICVNKFFAPLMRRGTESAQGAPADGELRSPELMGVILSARRGGVSSEDFTFRRDGAEIFYHARAIPVGVGETLVVLDDETERRRMEAARKNFVADAGHEFQTPLTAIAAAAELLSGMENSTAAGREPYIAEIARQRERMTALVDDLLFLSRLESGAPMAKTERFSLTDMCGALLGGAKSGPLAAKISWACDMPEGEIFFTGRAEEIKRAVSNLLDNAVKYVRKRYRNDGGGEISFSLKLNGDEIILRVGDNGTGIPADKLGSIFGRFERAEDDRARDGEKTGGYGLGLAIAKHAVESHGGKIEAVSANGSTVFTVTLPSAG